MRGVIYARYSSDNQREELIEGQLRECKEYAEKNDIQIIGTYTDRALSAKTDNRDIVQPNGIPAIVSQELFDRVQERMKENKQAPARHKAEDDYLLTTKLFCGKCQSMMVGESGTSHTKEVHRYYK